MILIIFKYCVKTVIWERATIMRLILEKGVFVNRNHRQSTVKRSKLPGHLSLRFFGSHNRTFTAKGVYEFNLVIALVVFSNCKTYFFAFGEGIGLYKLRKII